MIPLRVAIGTVGLSCGLATIFVPGSSKLMGLVIIAVSATLLFIQLRAVHRAGK